MTGAILTYYLFYKLFSTKGLQMEAVHTSVRTTLLLGTLIASMIPLQLMSMEPATAPTVATAVASTTAKKLATAAKQYMTEHAAALKGIAIVITATTLLLMSSENARTLTCKAYYKSILSALRLLQACPLPASVQEKIANKIEEIETLYATRAGENFTSENLRAMLKEFKDLWDEAKAGRDFCLWVIHPESILSSSK